MLSVLLFTFIKFFLEVPEVIGVLNSIWSNSTLNIFGFFLLFVTPYCFVATLFTFWTFFILNGTNSWWLFLFLVDDDLLWLDSLDWLGRRQDLDSLDCFEELLLFNFVGLFWFILGILFYLRIAWLFRADEIFNSDTD